MKNMQSVQAFSDIDIVAQCMADEERSRAFYLAILEVVKPGDVVVDVGTGTGLLALMAAKAGAKKVVAIEADPFVAEVARQNVEVNGYSDVIDIKVGDALTFNYNKCLPKGKKFDVVIMELLTTALIDEVQVFASNQLHKSGVVGSRTRFIPERVKSYVSLVNSNFRLFGLEMKMIRHLWKDFPYTHMTSQNTNELPLSDIKFNKIVEPLHRKKLVFKAINDILLNGIYIRSETILSKNSFIEDTLTLNAPVLIPINEIDVKYNDNIKLYIEYIQGMGYKSLKYRVN